MEGNIRVFDLKIKDDISDRVQRTVHSIAKSAGADAEVTIEEWVPGVFNDYRLTEKMIPVLERVAGKSKLSIAPQVTGGDDFAYYQEKVPGLFFYLNVKPPKGKVTPNHSPLFYVDEQTLRVGVRAMSHLAIEFMASN
jgi:metal-dependent amidase/aminoacylase/carboxypeptidase family protein